MGSKWYCIYRITNKINGKTYIGQHMYTNEANPMGKYRGSGVLLKKAYKKYGLENFETEILYKRIRDKETINAMEIWAIEKYKPEYNIAKGGYEIMTLETAKKISATMKGRKLSDEHKAKMSAAMKGRTVSWGSKISKANKGKKRSEDAKERISKTMKGIKPSEEHRKHLSEALKGKKLSEEHKAKLSASHKGKKFPEEQKRKMSEAHKAYWAAKRGE